MNRAYTITRTMPSSRLSIVAPAIAPEDFSISDNARQARDKASRSRVAKPAELPVFEQAAK